MQKAVILLNMGKLGKGIHLPLLGKAGEGRGKLFSKARKPKAL